MARLPPETFRLPVERMREGYYTDQYFNLTRDLLELEGHRPRVRMQVFQKQEAILGGVDEAIAVLKLCAGRHVDGGWEDGWDELEVRALNEGDADRAPRDGHDDRGRLRAVRPSRDGVPGVHGAAHAGHAQRQGGGRGGARQAHPLLPGPP